MTYKESDLVKGALGVMASVTEVHLIVETDEDDIVEVVGAMRPDQARLMAKLLIEAADEVDANREYVH